VSSIDKRGAKESAKRIARGLLTEWLQALAVLTEIALLGWPAVGTIQPGLVTGTEAVGVARHTKNARHEKTAPVVHACAVNWEKAACQDCLSALRALCTTSATRG
jgi:hypothetical protein